MPKGIVEQASLERGVRVRMAQMVYGFQLQGGKVVLTSEVSDSRVPNAGKGWRQKAWGQAAAIFKRLQTPPEQSVRRHRPQQLALFSSRGRKPRGKGTR